MFCLPILAAVVSTGLRSTCPQGWDGEAAKPPMAWWCWFQNAYYVRFYLDLLLPLPHLLLIVFIALTEKHVAVEIGLASVASMAHPLRFGFTRGH